MKSFNFPGPGLSPLSKEDRELLISSFFSGAYYDARKWRNRNDPKVASVLSNLPGDNLSEQVFGGLHGYCKCDTCAGEVKLASFTVGWERFCGRSCAQKNPKVRAKAKSTCLERHGGETIWDIPGNKERISKKISSTKQAKTEAKIKGLIKTDINVELVDGEWHWEHSCGKKWITTVARQKSSCPKCVSSKPELELVELIKSLAPNSQIKHRDRKIIAPKELDILVDSKFAIEYNGAYHHRDALPKAAQNKVVNAGLAGVRLFTVLESDWVLDRKAVESKIGSYLVPLKSIGARTLSVDTDVAQKEARDFLEENHFSGSCAAKEFIGLRNKDGLLMCIATFSFTRFKSKTKNEWELIRLCTLKGFVIPGGASRMIGAWKKNHRDETLISFHDLRFGWSDGLKNSNFELVEITKPGWRWIKGKAVLERWSTQKHKISKIVPNADLTKTEVEIMREAGWIQEFNVGNSKWKLKRN